MARPNQVLCYMTATVLEPYHSQYTYQQTIARNHFLINYTNDSSQPALKNSFEIADSNKLR